MNGGQGVQLWTIGLTGAGAVLAALALYFTMSTAVRALTRETEQLRRGERERAELWQQVHAVSSGIRRRLDAGEVLHEAVHLVGEAFGADRVYVRLVVDGRLGGVVAAWPASSPALPPPGGDDPGRLRELCAGRTGTADGGLLTMPFGLGGDLSGALVLVREDGSWRPTELEAVAVVADDLARGLDQSQRYERKNELLAQLRDLDQAKTEFLSTVSHELRTPLTSITGYVESLLDGDAGPVNDRQRRMLTTIERNGHRLRALIEDLLTLSRVESGTFRLVREPVDLGDAVAEAVADVQPSAARAGLTLTYRRPGPPVVVDGDREQLHRVVANLLSNAVKFTPSGGRVTVSAELDDDGGALFTVTDTGIGIPAADQRQLFSRFFRASNATEQVIQGTGLGLTIVQAIIGHHGGRIAIDSVENEGTTVTVRLPCGAASPAECPPAADARGRATVTVAADLAELAGPVSGVVELPPDLIWQPDRTFDLDDPGYLRWMYETVLRAASDPVQLRTWLHGPTLVRLWPELYLPDSVRAAWQARHPQLRDGAAVAYPTLASTSSQPGR